MRKNSVKNTRINGEVLKELSNIIRSLRELEKHILMVHLLLKNTITKKKL